VVPFAERWSDLGDWNAIWRESAGDEAGMVTEGSVTPIDCENSLMRSEVDGLELVGIGLTDMVTVAMDDTVLVAHRSRAQDVKQAVAHLKARHAAQAEGFAARRVAWSETVANGTRYASRCIQMAPGEDVAVPAAAWDTRWTVLARRAFVRLPYSAISLSTGATYVHRSGQTAQLSNPDSVPLVLVEVQEHRVEDVATEQSEPLAIAAA